MPYDGDVTPTATTKGTPVILTLKTRSSAPYALVKFSYTPAEYGTVDGKYTKVGGGEKTDAWIMGYAHSANPTVMARVRRQRAELHSIVNGQVQVEVADPTPEPAPIPSIPADAPPLGSPQEANLNRSNRALAAVKAEHLDEAEGIDSPDLPDAITDLLTDLRHLARRLDLDFNDLVLRASNHFAAEQKEAGARCPHITEPPGPGGWAWCPKCCVGVRATDIPHEFVRRPHRSQFAGCAVCGTMHDSPAT